MLILFYIPCPATSSVALAASPQEQSFIMLKPDAVQRGLASVCGGRKAFRLLLQLTVLFALIFHTMLSQIADIIKRFEAKGYKLVGIKVRCNLLAEDL
jgi:hypothetical protein